MSECGVGDNDCGDGRGWGNFFLKNLQAWDGVGDKLCGNGWGWGSLGNSMQASTI